MNRKIKRNTNTIDRGRGRDIPLNERIIFALDVSTKEEASGMVRYHRAVEAAQGVQILAVTVFSFSDFLPEKTRDSRLSVYA
jgi:hypothetical protein